MSSDRFVSIKGLHGYQFESNDRLLAALRKVESTLIEAGAKKGTDYTFLDLLKAAQTSMMIDAFTEVAEGIEKGLSHQVFGGGVSDAIGRAVEDLSSALGTKSW